MHILVKKPELAKLIEDQVNRFKRSLINRLYFNGQVFDERFLLLSIDEHIVAGIAQYFVQ